MRTFTLTLAWAALFLAGDEQGPRTLFLAGWVALEQSRALREFDSRTHGRAQWLRETGVTFRALARVRAGASLTAGAIGAGSGWALMSLVSQIVPEIELERAAANASAGTLAVLIVTYGSLRQPWPGSDDSPAEAGSRSRTWRS